MLEFNPNKRISAVEAIADPYFDDIRLPEQEVFETPKINLPVDDEGKEDLPTHELRKLIIEEMRALSSDQFDFVNDHEEEACEDYWAHQLTCVGEPQVNVSVTSKIMFYKHSTTTINGFFPINYN